MDVGQTVAASLSAPQLFLIANDLSQMQILASVDESDIGQIKNGSAGGFTVQAYPGQTFTGTVRQVRLKSTTVNNVVNYTAVVAVENPEGKLLPGMTATVKFLTGSAKRCAVGAERGACASSRRRDERARSTRAAAGARTRVRNASGSGRRRVARQRASRGAARDGPRWRRSGISTRRRRLKPVRVHAGLSDGSAPSDRQRDQGRDAGHRRREHRRCSDDRSGDESAAATGATARVVAAARRGPF